jgi:excisionase family DNA binding protein
MAILDLAFHPFAYVTINELAEYWRLGRRRVLDHIKAGHVEAIQLGPGLYRIRTITALTFERACAVPSARRGPAPAAWVSRSQRTTGIRPLGAPRALRESNQRTAAGEGGEPPSIGESNSMGH